MKYKLIIILSITFIYSCSQDITKILPNRNIDKLRDEQDSINTNANELAPYQRIIEDNCKEAYYKEHRNNTKLNETNIIKPANYFFKEIMGQQFIGKESALDELTNRLESVTFLTRNSGIVAISHPPDTNYSKLLNLQMYGSVGGTDLMTFRIENGKIVFRTLPEPINSIFWDSHPWIGQDSLCNYVLIWSSDRENPYSNTKRINGSIVNKGNSDLFYSFRINGVWSQPKRFETDKSINTDDFNEISPFVACMSQAPKLLFSSNRDGDYDIFYADLKFDFANSNILVLDTAKKFEKGSQFDLQKDYINTDANEMFPFVAFPYIDSIHKNLYFSSDRNSKEHPINQTGDTLIVSKGNYDLYNFDIELECNAPKALPKIEPSEDVLVQLTVIDINGNPVEKPLLLVQDIDSNDSNLVYEDNHLFKLKKGKNYKLFGGSQLYNLDCSQPSDSIIQYYRGTKYIINKPNIKKIENIVKYDSLINPTIHYAYDTTYVVETIPLTDEILSTQTKIIRDTAKTKINNEMLTEKVTNFKTVKCPPVNNPPNKPKNDDGLPLDNKMEAPKIEPNITWVEVNKMVIKKREWSEGGKIITKSKTIVTYDTIPNIDSINITVTNANIPSANTAFTTLNTNNISNKKVLYDTVVLEPVYYVKPDCYVEFMDIKSQYNKKVPYFQTAFWKVNTSAGLTKHLEDLQSSGYLARAGYIELSPKHRKYGVAFPISRKQRIAEYRYFASQVDGNMNVMRDVITDEFIPTMEYINNYSPTTKLLLKLEAYSDIRDAGICYYIGNTVEYIQGKESANGQIILSDEKITNNATLSNNNENLSKLRVYNGFNELFARLKNNKKFNEYLQKGLIFYPTMKFNSIEERDKALEKAKIIILAEGKFYDKTIKADEKDYDPIRRLNLYIKLIQYSEGKIRLSECCK